MRDPLTDQIKFLAVTVALSCAAPVARADDVPVCERSLVVRMKIERTLNKPCEDIATTELSSIRTDYGWTFDGRQLLPGDFSGLSGIRNAEFYGMTPDIDERALSGLTGLISATIRATGNTLPANLLADLGSLEDLTLIGPNFCEIAPSFLSTNTKLSTIDFQTSLTDVPATLFANLSELKRVNLNSNKLSVMPADLFKKNPRLVEVDASKNLITAVDSNLFSNNPELYRVRLNSNELAEFPANFCSGTPRLHYLYLQDNRLVNLTNPVCKVPEGPEGVYINLAYNGLRSLDPSHFSPRHFSATSVLSILGGNQLDEQTITKLRSILGDRLE